MEFLYNTIINRLKNMEKIDLNPYTDNIRMSASFRTGKDSTEKKSKDPNLLYKALISLRDEKKIKFGDTDMEAKYKAYCNQYK